jgi:membrane-associated protease RseP (regulator of RpoE activity)
VLRCTDPLFPPSDAEHPEEVGKKLFNVSIPNIIAALSLLGDTIEFIKGRWAINLAILAATLLLLIFFYYAGFMPAYVRIILSLLLFVGSGASITKANGFDGGLGFYMVRSKMGIRAIDNAARRFTKVWGYATDWGAVVGFGLFSVLLFRKRADRRLVPIFVLGMLSIIAIILFVIPASIMPISLINIPQIHSAVNSASSCIPASPQVAASGGESYGYYALVAVLVAGGVALMIPYLLFENAYLILAAIFRSIGSHPSAAATYNAINSQVPGVAPLIPGITIPLFAGIVAILIILVVHEFSHGLLARTKKVKIKSTGLLVFGIIPIGAFVEPDEKGIKKLDKLSQNRISVAGVTANLAFTFIFLALMLALFYYVLPLVSTSQVVVAGTIANSPSCNTIQPGSIILKIGNYSVGSTSDVASAESRIGGNRTVHVVTDKGTYTLTTEPDGKIGVLLENSNTQKNGALSALLYFIYAVAGLSFIFNFSLAAFNLLPIPGLDGFRIYGLELRKRKRLLILLAAIMIFLLFVNVLPLLTSLG